MDCNSAMTVSRDESDLEQDPTASAKHQHLIAPAFARAPPERRAADVAAQVRRRNGKTEGRKRENEHKAPARGPTLSVDFQRDAEEAARATSRHTNAWRAAGGLTEESGRAALRSPARRAGPRAGLKSSDGAGARSRARVGASKRRLRRHAGRK
eukprot:12695007-Alexandrium_andersonii.AAC.2